MDGPSPLSVGLSVLGSLRVDKPRPAALAPAPGHGGLADMLDEVHRRGVPALPGLLDRLDEYTAMLAAVDPDRLDRDDALAYWLNLYNAGALTLAGEAFATGEPSVIRLPGAFTREYVTVAGTALSLDDIEHGKIRRFKDPRVHAALVCGAASCPTLRYEPFVGDRLEMQLDDQFRSFLAAGAVVVEADTLLLSRVFLWYGGDFVRPGRMPTFLPAGRRRLTTAISPWLPEEIERWLASGRRQIRFQPYDWSLSCSVRKPV